MVGSVGLVGWFESSFGLGGLVHSYCSFDGVVGIVVVVGVAGVVSVVTAT